LNGGASTGTLTNDAGRRLEREIKNLKGRAATKVVSRKGKEESRRSVPDRHFTSFFPWALVELGNIPISECYGCAMPHLGTIC
jgi:hypothetical protein